MERASSNGEGITNGYSRYPLGRRPRNPVEEMEMLGESSEAEEREQEDDDEFENEGVEKYHGDLNAPLPCVNREVIIPVPHLPVQPLPTPTPNDVHTDAVCTMFSDLDVLDCSVCYEPLTIPVYQCIKSHIACSPCCGKLGHKCPMCSMHIGDNRCLAIEKVIESVKIACPHAKYGCNKILRYSEKRDHEKTCIFVPCPQPGCKFQGNSNNLALHFKFEHYFNLKPFKYGEFFDVSLRLQRSLVVLQAENDGKMFVVINNKLEHGKGNAVFVCQIWSNSLVPQFSYVFEVRYDGFESNYRLPQSSVEKIQDGRYGLPLAPKFLQIPSELFTRSGWLLLQFKITIASGATHSEGHTSGS